MRYKHDILRLRAEGKSYNQIAKELGCTKSTVCYHCGNKQKEKNLLRKQNKLKGNPKPPRFCKNCGEKILRPNIYCNTKCQQEHAHKGYISKWKAGEVDGSKAGVSVSNHVRRYLWEKYNGQCCECGWNTPNPITGKPILEIEHIDGDCTNNKEENLKLLCPNCHSLTTTYKALNYGKGNRQRLKYYKLLEA